MPKKKNASSIAREIARQIYCKGYDRRRRAPCERVQFMVGVWPNERPMGGLCVRAMRATIAQTLRELRVAK